MALDPATTVLAKEVTTLIIQDVTRATRGQLMQRGVYCALQGLPTS